MEDKKAVKRISKFKALDLANLTKLLFERVYSIKLQSFPTDLKLRSDLVEVDENTGNIKTIVEIKRNRISKKIVDEIGEKLYSLKELIKPEKIILMVYEFVDYDIKKILLEIINQTESANTTELEIIEIQDISSMLDANPDLDPLINIIQPPPLKKENDQIPFHLDQVEQIDRLNREPIAGSLAGLLNKQIFCNENRINHSFMIHLQGAWGEGKSTFLNLFGKKLREGNTKWVIIELNAWQHQSIDPPWWSFIDKIYRLGIKEIKPRYRPYLWIREHGRRLLKHKSLPKLLTCSLTIFFAWLLFHSRDNIYELIKNLTLPMDGKEGDGLDLTEIFKIAGAAGSLIGLIYSLSKFLSYPFFINSPEDAKTFVQQASDPMKKIKNHFDSLVGDFNRYGYNVGIFIDDLDRCDDTFTVRLLEGIQTLFKRKPVLYVVAGDRHWISKCFENHYSNFMDMAKEPGQSLGYLFLEKAFQLSVRLPKVSGHAKEQYWNYILTQKGSNSTDIQVEEQLLLELRNKVREKYNKENFSDPGKIGDFIFDSTSDPNLITELLLEVVNEESEDVKHLLRDHHKLIDTNPRSIKRLANQYSVYRDILIAEKQKFDINKLFRWLILQNKYPVFSDWLEENVQRFATSVKIPDQFKELTNNEKWKILFLGTNEKSGDKISVNDIKLFSGIYSKEEERG